jgi:hypothetical protein
MCTFFHFFRECPLNKYQINDKRACINLALGSIQEQYNLQSMKSQTEHINIHNFYLISEMFTIYLPFHTARELALKLCYNQVSIN